MDVLTSITLTKDKLEALYAYYFNTESPDHRMTIATTLFLIGCHLEGINWDETDMNCEFTLEITKKGGER